MSSREAHTDTLNCSSARNLRRAYKIYHHESTNRLFRPPVPTPHRTLVAATKTFHPNPQRPPPATPRPPIPAAHPHQRDGGFASSWLEGLLLHHQGPRRRRRRSLPYPCTTNPLHSTAANSLISSFLAGLRLPWPRRRPHLPPPMAMAPPTAPSRISSPGTPVVVAT